jgi:hypothetical protein
MKSNENRKLFGIRDFESLDCDDNSRKVLGEILEWLRIRDPTLWSNHDELEIEVEIIYEDLD